MPEASPAASMFHANSLSAQAYQNVRFVTGLVSVVRSTYPAQMRSALVKTKGVVVETEKLFFRIDD